MEAILDQRIHNVQTVFADYSTACSSLMLIRRRGICLCVSYYVLILVTIAALRHETSRTDRLWF